jgi:hypothetical protein
MYTDEAPLTLVGQLLLSPMNSAGGLSCARRM